MSLFVFALSILSAPVLPAQDAPDQETTTTATTPAKQERKICKRSQDTGSRMGSRRICKTAAEWRGEDSALGNNHKVDDPGQR